MNFNKNTIEILEYSAEFHKVDNLNLIDRLESKIRSHFFKQKFRLKDEMMDSLKMDGSRVIGSNKNLYEFFEEKKCNLKKVIEKADSLTKYEKAFLYRILEIENMKNNVVDNKNIASTPQLIISGLKSRNSRNVIEHKFKDNDPGDKNRRGESGRIKSRPKLQSYQSMNIHSRLFNTRTLVEVGSVSNANVIKNTLEVNLRNSPFIQRFKDSLSKKEISVCERV